MRPERRALAGDDRVVSAVAFSPDGKSIVSGSADNTLRLWDAETRQPIGEPLKGHTRMVEGVAFSPDGKRIVSGSADNTLRLWDAQTGKPIGEPLRSHTAAIAVAFSPDGNKIVFASRDKTSVWDVKTRIVTTLLGGTAAVLGVAFTNSSKERIVYASEDGAVRVWEPVSFEQLVAAADRRCPLSEEERLELELFDPNFSDETRDQKESCGEVRAPRQ
jgi:WD40 repeat protein